MQNVADQVYCLEMLNKWTKDSDNPELLEFRNAYGRQLAYVTSLETERYSYERISSALREERAQAILRARELEKMRHKAEERIEKLERQLKLFVG